MLTQRFCLRAIPAFGQYMLTWRLLHRRFENLKRVTIQARIAGIERILGTAQHQSVAPCSTSVNDGLKKRPRCAALRLHRLHQLTRPDRPKLECGRQPRTAEPLSYSFLGRAGVASTPTTPVRVLTRPVYGRHHADKRYRGNFLAQRRQCGSRCGVAGTTMALAPCASKKRVIASESRTISS